MIAFEELDELGNFLDDAPASEAYSGAAGAKRYRGDIIEWLVDAGFDEEEDGEDVGEGALHRHARPGCKSIAGRAPVGPRSTRGAADADAASTMAG